jgi:hypothetical protein
MRLNSFEYDEAKRKEAERYERLSASERDDERRNYLAEEKPNRQQRRKNKAIGRAGE